MRRIPFLTVLFLWLSGPAEAIEPFSLAVLEFNPGPVSPEENLERLAGDVRRAAARGARLVLTPEMALLGRGGYHYKSREQVGPMARKVPGPITERIRAVAQANRVLIATSLAERDPGTGLLYLTAVLVGPKGLIGKYRKTHLWHSEATWATPGDLGIPVFETGLGRMAFLICMDLALVEPARLAALEGADLLLVPMNSTGQVISLLQATALYNGVYVAGANRAGDAGQGYDYHMVGSSAVWSPAGRKLAEAGFVNKGERPEKTPLIVARIDPAGYQNPVRDFLGRRRPSLYRDLSLFAPGKKKNGGNPPSLTAAVLQFAPAAPGDNLKEIRRLLGRAVGKARRQKRDLELVVLPELALTGPLDGLSRKAIRRRVRRAAGLVEGLARLAKSRGVTLVIGTVEKRDTSLYNAVLVLSQRGKLVRTCRKTHLDDGDRRWAAAGDRLCTVDLPGIGRLGVLIGSEAHFAELASLMALRRVDLIALPASPEEIGKVEVDFEPRISKNRYPEGAGALWDATARYAQAYTLVANFTGSGAGGRSGLYTLDPIYGLDQPVVVSGDRAQVLLVDIPLEKPGSWWFNQRHLNFVRRPDLYRRLYSKKATTPR